MPATQSSTSISASSTSAQFKFRTQPWAARHRAYSATCQPSVSARRRVAQVYHADTPCLAKVFHCPQCASRPASDVNACYSTPDPAQMRRHALACGRPATLALDSLSSSQGSLPQRPSFACRTCTPQASFANSAMLSQHRRLTHQRKVQVTYAKLQVTQSIERDPQTLRE